MRLETGFASCVARLASRACSSGAAVASPEEGLCPSGVPPSSPGTRGPATVGWSNSTGRGATSLVSGVQGVTPSEVCPTLGVLVHAGAGSGTFATGVAPWGANANVEPKAWPAGTAVRENGDITGAAPGSVGQAELTMDPNASDPPLAASSLVASGAGAIEPSGRTLPAANAPPATAAAPITTIARAAASTGARSFPRSIPHTSRVPMGQSLRNRFTRKA